MTAPCCTVTNAPETCPGAGTDPGPYNFIPLTPSPCTKRFLCITEVRNHRRTEQTLPSTAEPCGASTGDTGSSLGSFSWSHASRSRHRATSPLVPTAVAWAALRRKVTAGKAGKQFPYSRSRHGAVNRKISRFQPQMLWLMPPRSVVR